MSKSDRSEDLIEAGQAVGMLEDLASRFDAVAEPAKFVVEKAAAELKQLREEAGRALIELADTGALCSPAWSITALQIPRLRALSVSEGDFFAAVFITLVENGLLDEMQTERSWVTDLLRGMIGRDAQGRLSVRDSIAWVGAWWHPIEAGEMTSTLAQKLGPRQAQISEMLRERAWLFAQGCRAVVSMVGATKSLTTKKAGVKKAGRRRLSLKQERRRIELLKKMSRLVKDGVTVAMAEEHAGASEGDYKKFDSWLRQRKKRE